MYAGKILKYKMIKLSLILDKYLYWHYFYFFKSKGGTVRWKAIINGLQWALVVDDLGLPVENGMRGTYHSITDMIAGDFW